MSESQTNETALYEADGYACQYVENGCYVITAPSGIVIGLPFVIAESQADFEAALALYLANNP